MILLFFILNYTITNVETDARWADHELIIETSGLKVGNQFKANDIAQAINNLAKLKLFNFIALDTAIVGDGIFLKIMVEEAPYLKVEPKFSGNKKIKDKDLREKIELHIGKVITEKTIFDAKQGIIEKYEEKYFYGTSVQESLFVDSLNKVEIRFIINEGVEPRIGRIAIEGNNSFPDADIKRQMSTKEKGFLRSGRLTPEKLEEDIDKIGAFYKEKGFLDVQIDEPIIDVQEDRFVITITVHENMKYYIGSVAFKNNTVFDTMQLKTLLKYRSNDIYNIKEIDETIQSFYSAYADEGYIYSNIIPNENVRDSLIDIEYVFNEAEPANINRVIIAGNHSTWEKVIRREIYSIPGTRFRRSDVIRSQRQIFNLGYFDDVQISTGAPDDSGDIDLIYTVIEKEGVATVGAGIAYSALDRLTGYVELSHPNLFGRGQRIYTKVEAGGRLTNFQVGFTEPWLFDTRTSAGLDVYYTNRLWDYYTKRDIGFATRLSFPFYLDYTRFNYTFRAERTKIFDIASTYVPSSSGYSLYDDTIPKWTMANSFGIVRDARDYIFNPSSGSYISLQTEFAKKFLFANIDYNRATLEVRAYFPLVWKLVLMSRAKMGVVTSSDEVPLYKRFYAGGIGEDGVRGYPDRSLSPIEDGRKVGGDVILINNLELKLKLSQSFAFLAFYDAGNTFTSYEDINLGDLRRGAGVGVRIEVPMMGILGFDLGYGFDKADPGFEPHFQINPFGMF